MFEKASRLKLGFVTSVGVITVNDLWDLPLRATNNGLCLNSIARDLNKGLKDDEEDFVAKKKVDNEILNLKFKIVLRVIEVRLEEVDAATKKAENKIKKAKILDIIADKEDSSLKRRSKVDLEKMLEDL